MSSIYHFSLLLYQFDNFIIHEKPYRSFFMVASYKQFCPVAMAAEVLETRWTLLIVRELCLGSKHFNELRRGVPKMSPTLLSKRLRELEGHGILTIIRNSDNKSEYVLTDAGNELLDVIVSIGSWGKRWISHKHHLENSDEGLLVWDIRRNLNLENFPKRNAVMQIRFRESPAKSANWWFIFSEIDAPDVGPIDPNLDVDLYLETTLPELTKVWLGEETVSEAIASDHFIIAGDPELIGTFEEWIGTSNFAGVQSKTA
jgi:DNA-binding HxlR family transcriptional regulator